MTKRTPRLDVLVALCFGLTLTVLCRPAPGAESDANKADLKALEGYWTIESLEVGGERIDALRGGRIVFTETEHTIRHKGAPEAHWPRGSQKINASTSPKQIDIHPKTGPHIGKTHLGIYEINGDRARICFPDPPTEKRLTEFSSTAGDRAVLITATRYHRPAHPHQAEENGLYSNDSRIKTSIKFNNKSGQPIKIYWIDFAGERKSYGTADPGAFQELETFLTHPWLITDANEVPWYIFFADAQPRTVEIVAPKAEGDATSK